MEYSIGFPTCILTLVVNLSNPKWWVLALALGLPAISHAQLRPRAQVTPFLETEPGRPGETVRLAVRVSLPEALHVQSDRPRDPSLSPTALALEDLARQAGNGVKSIMARFSAVRLPTYVILIAPR